MDSVVSTLREAVCEGAGGQSHRACQAHLPLYGGEVRASRSQREIDAGHSVLKLPGGGWTY